MFSHELSVEQYSLMQAMVTTVKLFSVNATKAM